MKGEFRAVRVVIDIQHGDSKGWNEEWEIWWKNDDPTLKLNKEIEKMAEFPYSGKDASASPQEFVELLRDLAIEIEVIAELEEDAK
jgi:hypothetical protein